MAGSAKNLVLVGRSQNGICTTWNTLLCQNMFPERGASTRCQMYNTTTQDGQIINVIKTPGMSNLSLSEEFISKEINSCLSMAEEGIHAVLFVISMRNRITQEEEYALNNLQRIFGSIILDYVILLLTDWEKFEQVELEDYLREGCPEFLTKLLRVCKGRRVLFNNKTRDDDLKAKQLNQVMAHVTTIGKQNGGKPYTDDMRRYINSEAHERETSQVKYQHPKTAHISEAMKNIVLVGRTGNGKSATGNTILGQNMFVSQRQAGGVTMECEMHRAAIGDGQIINVIDTPGLFDSSVSSNYISTEIINCLTMAEGGIHAVLYVLSLGNRITKEEESTLDTLQLIFESKILDYLIVVFTGGDMLEANGKTLKDYFSKGCPEFLTRALRLCGGRKVLFNNMTKDIVKKDEQVKQLLAHIATIDNNNGGKPYTNKMHRKIKEERDNLTEQKHKAGSKKHASEIELMMTNLELQHDEKTRRMTQILERRLKQNSEARERLMREMENAMKNH